MLPLTDNTRACLLMALSMAGFTINDAIIKGITAEMAAGQIMLVRGVIMAALLYGLIRFKGDSFSPKMLSSGAMWLRTISEAVATICFLFALARVPIASVSAVLQALPLAVTLGAALFFGEKVGWRRISAILIGFVGVMMVIQPGVDSFNPAILVVLGTVVLATVRDLSTRAIPSDVSALHISLITTLAVMVTGLVMMAVSGDRWTALEPQLLAVLTIAALFLFVGYQCIVLAMRLGDTSVVAPFRYTSLLWAIALGYLFFNEVPNALALLGAALIVGSGVYTIFREHVLTRSTKAASISAVSPPPARGT